MTFIYNAYVLIVIGALHIFYWWWRW